MKVNVIYNVTGRVKSMSKVYADLLVKLKKVRIVDDSVFELAPVEPIPPAPEPNTTPTADPVAEITTAENTETTDLFKNADVSVNEKPNESVATKPRAINQKSKATDPEA